MRNLRGNICLREEAKRSTKRKGIWICQFALGNLHIFPSFLSLFNFPQTSPNNPMNCAIGHSPATTLGNVWLQVTKLLEHHDKTRHPHWGWYDNLAKMGMWTCTNEFNTNWRISINTHPNVLWLRMNRSSHDYPPIHWGVSCVIKRWYSRGYITRNLGICSFHKFHRNGHLKVTLGYWSKIDKSSQ